MNNMKEMVFGFVPTQFDGTEYVITEEKLGTLPLPASYSYLPFMSPIMDQGSTSTCVPHSISAVYDYYIAMNHPELTNNGQFVVYSGTTALAHSGNDLTAVNVTVTIENINF